MIHKEISVSRVLYGKYIFCYIHSSERKRRRRGNGEEAGNGEVAGNGEEKQEMMWEQYNISITTEEHKTNVICDPEKPLILLHLLRINTNLNHTFSFLRVPLGIRLYYISSDYKMYHDQR